MSDDEKQASDDPYGLNDFGERLLAHGGRRCDDPQCCSARRPPQHVVSAALDEISAMGQEAEQCSFCESGLIWNVTGRGAKRCSHCDGKGNVLPTGRVTEAGEG